MITLLFLLLPIAAATGWYAGYKFKSNPKRKNNLNRDYFIGLKYLIDEQPDKALDVFIKLLDVNPDTVETHLTLAGLFRKRGEVDRAIRIHQNLIARSQLAKADRAHTLFELAKDYLSAGVLNRAEKLFLELIDLGEETKASHEALLHIYEQQKDWQQAIAIATKLERLKDVNVNHRLAYYYCELGDIKKALVADKNCVRASILQGESYIQQQQWKAAIKSYKRAIEQDPDYISEIIQPLTQCYVNINNQSECMRYLQQCLLGFPRISIILALADSIRQQQGDIAAIEFTVAQMQAYPSLRGINYLTELYINRAEGNTKTKLVLLQQFMAKLFQDKPIYRCTECGFSSKVLYWQCPGCHEWGTVKPIHGLEGD